MTKTIVRDRSPLRSGRTSTHDRPAQRRRGTTASFDAITAEERAEISESLAEFRRGEIVSSDEVRAMLAAETDHPADS